MSLSSELAVIIQEQISCLTINWIEIDNWHVFVGGKIHLSEMWSRTEYLIRKGCAYDGESDVAGSWERSAPNMLIDCCSSRKSEESDPKYS